MSLPVPGEVPGGQRGMLLKEKAKRTVPSGVFDGFTDVHEDQPSFQPTSFQPS